MKSPLPAAVVLRLKYGGYGIVRTLSKHNIPLIGFEKDLSCPEAQTRLCEVREYDSLENLLPRLKAVSEAQPVKPVLYLTNDSLVEFCSQHLDIIQRYFHIDFVADPDVIQVLLHKNRFATFAESNGFNVPRTVVVRSGNDWVPRIRDLRLPCVLKPYKRSPNWQATGQPKAKRYTDHDVLIEQLQELVQRVDALIVQEWIPGKDDAVYFCLVYYDSRGQCLSSFTGRKLRQWPPKTGTTSAAEPAHAPVVARETRRLFDRMSYRGLGSVEFKKHARTGEFFITEPTVGRVNQQSLVAPANGVNLPLLAYSSLTGHPFPQQSSSLSPTTYVDEKAELRNLIRGALQGTLHTKGMLHSYHGRRVFRFCTRGDLRPFVRFLRRTALRLPVYLAQEVRRNL